MVVFGFYLFVVGVDGMVGDYVYFGGYLSSIGFEG